MQLSTLRRRMVTDLSSRMEKLGFLSCVPQHIQSRAEGCVARVSLYDLTDRMEDSFEILCTLSQERSKALGEGPPGLNKAPFPDINSLGLRKSSS